MPAIWSAVAASPFLGTGTWLYQFQSDYPPVVALPFVAFGVFILAIGLYIHLLAPSKPRFQEDETVLEMRHPTQRVALVKIATGIPLLLTMIYLLFFTMVPYVYPTIFLISGLYYFSTGIRTYWINSLTSYWITTNRIIKEYRFVSLIRQEIPLSKVRGVQERKSITETLVGLGNVRVASGRGSSLEIEMTNMDNSEEFADTIRKLL